MLLTNITYPFLLRSCISFFHIMYEKKCLYAPVPKFHWPLKNLFFRLSQLIAPVFQPTFGSNLSTYSSLFCHSHMRLCVYQGPEIGAEYSYLLRTLTCSYPICQKLKYYNHNNWGPVICKMMRRFEIWPQNINQITYDPLLDKNFDNFAISVFFQFSTGFLPQKGVKCYSISISRPNLNPLIILHIKGPQYLWF